MNDSVSALKRIILCCGIVLALAHSVLSQDMLVIRSGAVTSSDQHRAVVRTVFSAVTQPTQVWCEFGTSANYGEATPVQQLSAGDVPVANIVLDQLNPQTEYHYRVATKTPSGMAYSADQHFHTVASGTVGEELVPLTLGNGGKQTLGLWLGLHPKATTCMDSELGEEDLGSTPGSEIFDARFVDVHSSDGSCIGAGMLRDYRALRNPGQADTFLVRFQAGAGGYPVKMSWPDLSAWFTGRLKMLIPISSGRAVVDMIAAGSCTITDPSVDHVYIVSGTGLAGVDAPLIASETMAGEGQSSVQVTASLEPNGLQTSAWFQWGTSTNYSNSTASSIVNPAGYAAEITGQLDGLAPATTYHFRLAARNEMGTTYGEDQVFTTVGEGTIGSTIFRLNVGSSERSGQGLWIGVHPRATVCLDPGLGEREIPPAPSRTLFDARLMRSECSNAGTHVDLRPFTDSARIDTYRVELQIPQGAASLTLSWDDVSAYYSGSVRLVDAFGGLAVNIDMQKQTEYVLTDPDVHSFYVITGGSDVNAAVPSVLTDPAVEIDGSSVSLAARVNPNGFETSVWFEWGSGETAGDLVQSGGRVVPKSRNVTALAETLADLEPGKAYFYRVVAQNSHGVRKGPDRMLVVSVGNVVANYPDGWSIIAQPSGTLDKSVIARNDQPAASMAMFEFHGGYGAVQAMENGKGYWAKFAGGAIVGYNGKMRVIDTVMLRAGWNMIGGLGYPVDVAAIGAVTPGLQTSSFFGYTSHGYRQTDTLQPGFGYWVKALSDGAIVLTAHANNFSLPKVGRLPGAGDPPAPPITPAEDVVRAVKAAGDIPATFELLQNYPNPFNPATELRFDLPQDSRVTLKVYNLLGVEVASLFDGAPLGAGRHSVAFNGGEYPSGVYFYRIQAGDWSAVRKMTLMK